MSITARTIYRDSFNFLRNQLTSIMLLSLLVALIAVILSRALQPDLSPLGADSLQALLRRFMEDQQMLLNLVQNQQHFWLFAKAILVTAVVQMIAYALLIASVVNLLIMVSSGKRISALQAFGASAGRLPHLLLLMLICFAILLILSMVVKRLPPVIGVLMMPVLLFTYSFTLCLAPVILLVDRASVFTAIRQSFQITTKNPLLILPILLIWLALYFVLNLLAGTLFTLLQNSEMTSIIIFTLANLLLAWVMVYLFRLYMLMKS